MKRKLTADLASNMLPNLDSGDSDAGDLPEVESDSNVSWVHEHFVLILMIQSRGKRDHRYRCCVHGLHYMLLSQLESTSVLDSSQPEVALDKGQGWEGP